MMSNYKFKRGWNLLFSFNWHLAFQCFVYRLIWKKNTNTWYRPSILCSIPHQQNTKTRVLYSCFLCPLHSFHLLWIYRTLKWILIEEFKSFYLISLSSNCIWFGSIVILESKVSNKGLIYITIAIMYMCP